MLFSFVGFFKNLILSLNLFIIAFLIALFIKAASFALTYFILIGASLSRTFWTVTLKWSKSDILISPLFNSCSNCDLKTSLQSFCGFCIYWFLILFLKKYYFKTVTTIFWKSKMPLSIRWKLFLLFVRTKSMQERSMQEGLSQFLN